MTEDEARPIFQQLCEAAAYLHNLGIVHRSVVCVHVWMIRPHSFISHPYRFDRRFVLSMVV
jgi:serine/threonine protein kinase